MSTKAQRRKAIAGALTVSAIGLQPTAADAFPSGGAVNPWEVALCAVSSWNCWFAYNAASAAQSDAANWFGAQAQDGMRGNAFQHSSWNARMAVLIGRGNAQAFSDAHELPITSGNPPGADLTNRHERQDLCNNRRGWNRPSNWQIVTLDQMTSVNQLSGEASAMSESSDANPEAFNSWDSCDGSRLVFIRKNNGNYFS